MWKQWKQWEALFSWVPKPLQMVMAAMKLKDFVPWKKNYDQPRQHVKKQRHYFANKGPSHQSYGFSSSHVWMWELDQKEGWAMKNWCFWTVVLGLESALNCKGISLFNPNGNQPWVFIGRTDTEAEAPILWHLMQGAESLEKTLMLGNTEGKRRREWQRMQWFNSIRLNGLEFWANSRRWWRTEKPGMLQSIRSQRVGHNWATEQQQNPRLNNNKIPI